MDAMDIKVNALEREVEAFNAAKAANDEKSMREHLLAAREKAAEVKSFAPRHFYRTFEGIEGKLEKVLAVIRAFSFTYKALQEERSKETDAIVGLSIVDKEARVNLQTFCGEAGVPKFWVYDYERFNELITLRVAKDMGVDVTPIVANYKLSTGAEEKRVGTTSASALSNNTLQKELQAVVDAIIFDDDGTGANKYKVNSHDVAYILTVANKAGKERCTVVAGKHNWMRTLLLDVLYRIITPDYKYAILYKGK